MTSRVQNSSQGKRQTSSGELSIKNSKQDINASTLIDHSKYSLIKMDEEFKIYSGFQEYQVCKVNGLFIVKPASAGNINPLSQSTNNCLFINQVPYKVEENAVVNNKSTKTVQKTQNRRPSTTECTKLSKKLHNDSKVKSKIMPLQNSGKYKIMIELNSNDISNQVNQEIRRRPSSTQSSKSKVAKKISDYTKTSSIVSPSKNTWRENNVLNKNSRDFLNQVNQAIKLQKLFTIGNQNRQAFPTIRKSLTARGWVEKCSAQALFEEEAITSKMAETTMRLLKEAPVNFIWVIHNCDFGNILDSTIVSRFPKNNHFTTKVGLCSFLEDFHWHYESNLSKVVSPRTFNIGNGDDIDNFIKEFGLTACVSLLKIIVQQVSTAESDHFFRDGKVSISVVDFANAQCSEYILHRNHDDIDRQEDNIVTHKEWIDFLVWFYMIAHEGSHFETTSYPMIQALYTMSKMTLKNIEPYWPQLEIEGSRNLWVVKPAAQFCGRGVHVMSSLESIIGYVELVADSPGRASRYVVQKYIEHPLLIFNTKFDIRQWFLITSVYPLGIWIYKECYLRFSSQPFSLDNLHESIHLTNNAIQKNYSNNSSRHTKLPEQNMWHCFTFQEYLKEIGEGDKWHDVILPGIKQGIIGAVLASQDEMIDRKNSFELYGADFLLGKDYTPILLEINMGPSMAPSTDITADLCRDGLEDVIKVVLDRAHKSTANTGKFELLYKQEMGPKHPHVGLDLMVCGTKVIPERRIRNCNDIKLSPLLLN